MPDFGKQPSCKGLEVGLQKLTLVTAKERILCCGMTQCSLPRFSLFIRLIKHLRKFKSKQLCMHKVLLVLLLLPINNE